MGLFTLLVFAQALPVSNGFSAARVIGTIVCIGLALGEHFKTTHGSCSSQLWASTFQFLSFVELRSSTQFQKRSFDRSHSISSLIQLCDSVPRSKFHVVFAVASDISGRLGKQCAMLWTTTSERRASGRQRDAPKKGNAHERQRDARRNVMGIRSICVPQLPQAIHISKITVRTF